MDYQIKQMIGDEETHRYVLASRCTKPLVVIGVNPSTANEKQGDLATFLSLYGSLGCLFQVLWR